MSPVPPKARGAGIGAGVKLQMSFHSVSDGKQILKGLNRREEGGAGSTRRRKGRCRAQRGTEQCHLPEGRAINTPDLFAQGLGAPLMGPTHSRGMPTVLTKGLQNPISFRDTTTKLGRHQGANSNSRERAMHQRAGMQREGGRQSWPWSKQLPSASQNKFPWKHP